MNLYKDLAEKILVDVGNEYVEVDGERVYLRSFEWFRQLCSKYGVEYILHHFKYFK